MIRFITIFSNGSLGSLDKGRTLSDSSSGIILSKAGGKTELCFNFFGLINYLNFIMFLCLKLGILIREREKSHHGQILI